MPDFDPSDEPPCVEMAERLRRTRPDRGDRHALAGLLEECLFPVELIRAGPHSLELEPVWEEVRQAVTANPGDFFAELNEWTVQDATGAPGSAPNPLSGPAVELLLAQWVIRRLVDRDWATRERIQEWVAARTRRRDSNVAHEQLEQFLTRVTPPETALDVLWCLAQTPTTNWEAVIVCQADNSATRRRRAGARALGTPVSFEERMAVVLGSGGAGGVDRPPGTGERTVSTLASAVAGLDSADRELLELKFLYRWSQREIANHTKKSEPSVSCRLNTLRAVLHASYLTTREAE